MRSTDRYESLYRSTDRSVHWFNTGTDLPVGPVTIAAFDSVTIVGLVGSDLVWGGIFISTDKGEHWTRPVGDPRAIFMYSCVQFASSLYMASSAGVLRSTDNGYYWTSCNGGLKSPCVSALTVLGSKL